MGVDTSIKVTIVMVGLRWEGGLKGSELVDVRKGQSNGSLLLAREKQGGQGRNLAIASSVGEKSRRQGRLRVMEGIDVAQARNEPDPESG